MITREYQLDKEPAFDFNIVAPRERIIFFDIETTGLSRDRAFIYLIGLVIFEDGKWLLRQYFSEGPSDEKRVLEAFGGELDVKRRPGRIVLITFNGDGFDIPFVRDRWRRHGLPGDIENGAVSLDLFKKIRPYKKLLGMDSCSLKAVERLHGIYREDRYSGGELIYVYEEYLRMARIEKGMLDDNELNLRLREKLLETLLLHNAEDIADMPLIMDVTGYEELFKGSFEIISSRIVDPGQEEAAGRTRDSKPEAAYEGADEEGPGAGISINTGKSGAAGVTAGADISAAVEDCPEDAERHAGDPAYVWDIWARLAVPLPKGIYLDEGGMALSIGGEDPVLMNLTASVCEGEFRYYFEDYKNYYYLPAEDMAVHKSVGEYVVRSARRQATAATCYQRKRGRFVRDPGGVLGQGFYKESKKGPRYGDIGKLTEKNNHIVDTSITKRYILTILDGMVCGSRKRNK